MANRSHSARRIKRRWTYDVAEAAKATGATPGTLRHWHKKHGLEAVTVRETDHYKVMREFCEDPEGFVQAAIEE